MAKIIIAGGTGFLGTNLCEFLRKKGHDISILSRKVRKNVDGIRYVLWDGKNTGAWISELEASEAIINLSGRSIDTTFTDKHKEQILESRINSTMAISKAIQEVVTPPKTWINASAVGIYGDRKDEILTESSYPGDGFVAEVCIKWETKVFDENFPNTRQVAIRTGLVLDAKEGLLWPLSRITKLGMGGKAGSGGQYMPWIHINDWVKLVYFFIFSSTYTGPVNASAPNPVSNKEFMRTLRKTLGIPFGIPQPAWAIQLGGKLIGTEAELILTGQKAIPDVALKNGFTFEFNNLEGALGNLLIK